MIRKPLQRLAPLLLLVTMAAVLSGEEQIPQGRTSDVTGYEASSPAVAQAEAQSPLPDDNRFSKGFVDAAIEALSSMRAWATNLGVIIKKGYPVSNLMIEKWQEPAMKNFALANSAVSNDADRKGLQLLTTEYNNLQDWSAKLVEARKSMSAANYSMADDALLNDPASQKILTCWKFLGPMLARGSFEDDGSCR